MSSILKVDKIQNAAGTTGLTIDSDGVLLKPNVPAFYGYKTTIQTAAAADEICTWTESLDRGGNFNNGVFTCPVDGLYFFSCVWLSTNDSLQSDVHLYKNDVIASRSRNAGVFGHETTTINYVGLFDADDTVYIGIPVVGHAVYGDTGLYWSTFMGHLIG